jgi:hypothetical protein
MALLALVALAAALRLSGLDRLQPHAQEADAYLVLQMQLHRDGEVARGDLPVAYYAYPTLAARALAWIPAARLAPDTPPERYLERSLAAASADVVRVRALVALVSVWLAPLTWLLARRLLGGGPALLAAALVALSVLHLLFGQQARPHGLQATFALASVLAAMRLRERPTWGAYALGAACCALAWATLHNGIAALLPLFAGHFLRERAPRRPWWAAGLFLVPLALVAWAFYPPRLAAEGGVLDFGGHTLPLSAFDGSGFRLVARYLWDYEPALLIASLAGLACGAAALALRSRAVEPADRQRRADVWIALAYALPYFAALCLTGLTQDRFLLPLLPFLACIAAWPVALARAKPVFAWCLALLVLVFPVLAVAQFVRLRAAPDTIERAAEWVEAHVDPESERVATSASLALPLLHAPEALRAASEDYATRQNVWMRWQLAHLPLEEQAPFGGGRRWKLFLAPGKLLHMNKPHSREELEAWLDGTGADYAILERSRRMEFIPQAAALRELVAERGELVEAIRGEDERWCTERPQDFQEIPSFVPRLLAATAFGPCIEIYRLPR